MTRILALLLLILLALLLVQRAWLAFGQTPVGRRLRGVWRAFAPPASDARREPASREGAGPLRLARCAGCGVHVPEDELREARCRRCRGGAASG